MAVDQVVIVPTGDEVYAGLVLDTNSPALMEIILEKFPQVCIKRVTPVVDNSDAICQTIKQHENCDLIIVIGGSGGGKKYDSDLAADETHLALDAMLTAKVVKEIYGFNGHLWSRLVVGRMEKNCLVANVPGPYTEAVAAGRALLDAMVTGLDLPVIAETVANAVLAQYPSGGNIR